MNWACVQEACGKELAEVIARTLQNVGFKVWLSQDFQTPDGERTCPHISTLSISALFSTIIFIYSISSLALSMQQINRATLTVVYPRSLLLIHQP